MRAFALRSAQPYPRKAGIQRARAVWAPGTKSGGRYSITSCLPLTNNFGQNDSRFAGHSRVVHNFGGPVSQTERMYRIIAIVASLTLTLICSAAAKHTVRVPLPPSKPFKSVEDQKQQNSKPASALFSEKTLPTLGKAMAIGYYPSGCLQ